MSTIATIGHTRTRGRSIPLLEIPCMVCGTLCYRRPSRLKKSGLCFCSQRCSGVHVGRGRRGVPVGQARRHQASQSNVSWPEDFWRQVAKGNADECWEWLGYRYPSGYGRLYVTVQVEEYPEGPGKIHYAHRVGFWLQHGTLIRDLDVCHTCDNPPCVNGLHLFQGTASDNVRDAVAKGRWTQKRFTLDQIAIIQAQFCSGEMDARQLATEYQVSIATMRKYLRQDLPAPRA